MHNSQPNEAKKQSDITQYEKQIEQKKGIKSWLASWKIYLQPAAMRMLALGFIAGMPLPLVFGTLSFRLREIGINRATIGYLSWILLLYSLKFLWAPIVDRWQLPGLFKLLGRRRSWLLVAQIIVILGVLGMAIVNPIYSLNWLIVFTFLVAFGSTVQDIVIDAYRIESAENKIQAALSATYQTGYRLAMLLGSAGVLWLAAQVDNGIINVPVFQNIVSSVNTSLFGGQLQFSWFIAYFSMAVIMAVGVLFTLRIPEPNTYREREVFANFNEWFSKVILAPFTDFFQRYGKYALWLLLLMSTFRISDMLGGVMASSFYVDSGYSKEQIAFISKVYGTTMTILGTFLGGVLVFRYGLRNTMLLGLCGAWANNILYAILSKIGFNLYFLTFAISVDNLAAGISLAAFIAFLSSLTSSKYTATQYALFSSAVFFIPKLLAGFSGWFVDNFGYFIFFISAATLSIPVMLLVYLLVDKVAEK